MKQLFSWLVFRAFKIKEIKSKEVPEGKLHTKKKLHYKWRMAAIILAITSLALLLMTLLFPELKYHYQFSITYNTASIMFTCSGCFFGIGILIVMSLAFINYRQQQVNQRAGTKNGNE